MVATTVASFLPWARSGARLRDSYELVGVVGRLDLVPAMLAGPSVAWYFLPLCALLTCISVFLRCTLCSTVLGLVVGGATLGLVVAVIGSPLGIELGVPVAASTGLLSVVGALMVGAQGRGSRRDRRDEPMGTT